MLAYLECSARYFKQVTGAGPFAPDDVTNARHGRPPPNGTPGLQLRHHGRARRAAGLRHRHRAGRPGSRIKNLTYGGAAGRPGGQQFVIAINNYRQSGGGNFPGVTTAPVLYNAQVEIRQLLIDWVTAAGKIDALDRSPRYDWRLVANGSPVTVIGAAEGGRH